MVITAHQSFVAEKMYVSLELLFYIPETKPFVPSDRETVETYLTAYK